MKVSELIEKLEAYNDKDQHIACILWHDEDVLGVAEDNDWELTKGQVNKILDGLETTHNAEIGVNWDSIYSAIEYELINIK